MPDLLSTLVDNCVFFKAELATWTSRRGLESFLFVTQIGPLSTAPALVLLPEMTIGARRLLTVGRQSALHLEFSSLASHTITSHCR